MIKRQCITNRSVKEERDCSNTCLQRSPSLGKSNASQGEQMLLDESTFTLDTIYLVKETQQLCWLCFTIIVIIRSTYTYL